MDRATLEAWARGEAAPSEAAAAAATAAAVAAAPREEGGEAADEDAAAAEAEATEDATGPDLAMEGEQGFEAEEDDERPLATPPSEAELAYGSTSLRVARPKGYWAKPEAKEPTEAAADAPPTANTAPAAYTGITGGTGEVNSGTGPDAHGHSLAADGTVVHGSATPVVDRYDAALRTAQRIEEIAISANQIAQIAPAVTDVSAAALTSTLTLTLTLTLTYYRNPNLNPNPNPNPNLHLHPHPNPHPNPRQVSAASAQPGGPWAPPLFNSLPEVDRATLEAWARGEAAPSEAAKALEGSSVSSVASGGGPLTFHPCLPWSASRSARSFHV